MAADSSLEDFDDDRLRRLEQAEPVLPYEALATQRTVCSLGWAAPNVVAWEQRGAPQAQYLPPAPCYDVVLLAAPGDGLLLEQARLGQTHRAVLQSAELIIVPPHVPAYFRWNQPVDLLHFSIQPDALGDDGRGLRSGLRLRNSFGSVDPAAAALGQASLQQLRGPHPPVSQVLDSIHAALLVHLIDRHADRGPPPRTKGRLSPGELRRLVDYVQAHLSEALTLCRMAGLLGQSPYHFSRRFKQTTGMSPMRYVIDLRLERARQLLLSGSRSVLEVALETGFADGSHLARWYRRKYGHPPTRRRATRAA